MELLYQTGNVMRQINNKNVFPSSKYNLFTTAFLFFKRNLTHSEYIVISFGNS